MKDNNYIVIAISIMTFAIMRIGIYIGGGLVDFYQTLIETKVIIAYIANLILLCSAIFGLFRKTKDK